MNGLDDYKNILSGGIRVVDWNYDATTTNTIKLDIGDVIVAKGTTNNNYYMYFPERYTVMIFIGCESGVISGSTEVGYTNQDVYMQIASRITLPFKYYFRGTTTYLFSSTHKKKKKMSSFTKEDIMEGNIIDGAKNLLSGDFTTNLNFYYQQFDTEVKAIEVPVTVPALVYLRFRYGGSAVIIREGGGRFSLIMWILNSGESLKTETWSGTTQYEIDITSSISCVAAFVFPAT